MLNSSRCAVLGSPIAHSLSPVMHRRAYREFGLDWTFEAVEMEEPTLEKFLSGCDQSWKGLSLTMPLKHAAVGFVDKATSVVKTLNVANTIVFDDGISTASNTDVPGAIAALEERGVNKVKTARILGGGATASSLAYALATKGAKQIEFVVRNPETAVEAVGVAERAGVKTIVRHIDRPLIDVVDLLVSTVPASAVRKSAHDLVDSTRAVFDVIYDPWPTPLATATKHTSHPFVSGLDLLAHQASFQVELMTGSRIGAGLLRDAAVEELETRRAQTT